MNVLSLFDGMSCGRIALERAGIKIDKYFASEIDKYAIKVSKNNYPDTIHLGDVQNIQAEDGWLETDVKDSDGVERAVQIDLLIGGSPCQGFSFAGKRLNFDDPRSKLFWEFVRLLKELKPTYFLLENVRMNQRSQDVITEALGVHPVPINSSLVSAQNRKRLYWTNIPFKYPLDKGIMMKDILQDPSEISLEHYHSMKAVEYMEKGNDKWGQAGNRRADGYEQTPETQKSFTLTANMHKGVPYNYFKDTRNGLIKAGEADLKGHDYVRRVYHPDGKAPSLCAASGGNLEPKTLASDTKWRKLTPLECERLQTVPDDYTKGVSNTQRYKMIGNGWTVDVVAHIFKNLS